MNALFFVFWLAQAAQAAAPHACPPPKAYPGLSAQAKEQKFAASADACEKFSLAYELHFEGERFQKQWGLQAMEQLNSVGDYRSLSIYGLQLHDLLASADPDRAGFQRYALLGVHGALEHINQEHDQTWIHWALGMESEDPKAIPLSFDSFLERYPENPAVKEISNWKESAVSQFLELEKSIARGLFSRGDVFAPVVRFEGNLRWPSLQSSPQFPSFVWEAIRYRELFRSKLSAVKEGRLRMWLRVEGNARLDLAAAAKRIRMENCSDFAKVKALGLKFENSPEIRQFAGLCR